MKNYNEWILQSDYDLGTAEAMFESGRYFYAIFMCHLSLEKCLKGIYCKNLDELPPKTHNLVYLLEKMSLHPPEDIYQFIYSINAESVATRYPDDIQRAIKEYSKDKALEIINKSKQAIQWLKKN